MFFTRVTVEIIASLNNSLLGHSKRYYHTTYRSNSWKRMCPFTRIVSSSSPKARQHVLNITLIHVQRILQNYCNFCTSVHVLIKILHTSLLMQWRTTSHVSLTNILTNCFKLFTRAVVKCFIWLFIPPMMMPMCIWVVFQYSMSRHDCH